MHASVLSWKPLADARASFQPSSAEAKELHDLMMQVVERNVDEIDGETVVRMDDTEVRGPAV